MKKLKKPPNFIYFRKIIQSMNMLDNGMHYIGHSPLFHPLKNGVSLQPSLKLISPPLPLFPKTLCISVPNQPK